MPSESNKGEIFYKEALNWN